jgi:hypothetical protein
VAAGVDPGRGTTRPSARHGACRALGPRARPDRRRTGLRRRAHGRRRRRVGSRRVRRARQAPGRARSRGEPGARTARVPGADGDCVRARDSAAGCPVRRGLWRARVARADPGADPGGDLLAGACATRVRVAGPQRGPAELARATRGG